MIGDAMLGGVINFIVIIHVIVNIIIIIISLIHLYLYSYPEDICRAPAIGRASCRERV